MSTIVNCHCYVGGRENAQYQAMRRIETRLFRRYGTRLKIEFLNSDQLKAYGYTESTFVDWLLSCHFHLVICHPHQGACKSWSTEVLYRELLRLAKHIGFPNGEQLRCPIFTQDKIAYLHTVPELTNPTLRVWLDQDGDFDSQRDNIDR
jgi:hypothetical protein